MARKVPGKWGERDVPTPGSPAPKKGSVIAERIGMDCRPDAWELIWHRSSTDLSQKRPWILLAPEWSRPAMALPKELKGEASNFL